MLIDKHFVQWLTDNYFQVLCDRSECKSCPFRAENNKYGIKCTNLDSEQRLEIFKQVYTTQ